MRMTLLLLLRWGMTRMRSDLLVAGRAWCQASSLCGVCQRVVAVSSRVLVLESVSCGDERVVMMAMVVSGLRAIPSR